MYVLNFDSSYPMVSLEGHESSLQVDAANSVNLASIWSVHDDYSIRHRKVELSDATSPSTSLHYNLGARRVKAIVGPIRPHTLLEHAVAIETQITLGSQRAELPVLSSGTTSVPEVLLDLSDGTSEGLSVSELVVVLFGLSLLLRTLARLALGLGNSLCELLHFGEGSFEVSVSSSSPLGYIEGIGAGLSRGRVDEFVVEMNIWKFST